MKRVDNKGFGTLLMVLMIGTFLISTFTTVYVYLVNRTRHHARIKETYNMVSVMEQASRIIKGSFDLNAAGGVPDPDINTWTWPGDTCNGGCGAVADLAFCVDNFNNPAQPYCFSKAAAMMRVGVNFQAAPPFIDNRWSRFYAKFEKFFDDQDAVQSVIASMHSPQKIKTPTIFGWMLWEKSALAQVIQTKRYKGRDLPPKTDNPQAYEECERSVIPAAKIMAIDCTAAPATPGCKQCQIGGLPNIGLPPCVSVGIKPWWSADPNTDIKQSFTIVQGSN